MKDFDLNKSLSHQSSHNIADVLEFCSDLGAYFRKCIWIWRLDHYQYRLNIYIDIYIYLYIYISLILCAGIYIYICHETCLHVHLCLNLQIDRNYVLLGTDRTRTTRNSYLMRVWRTTCSVLDAVCNALRQSAGKQIKRDLKVYKPSLLKNVHFPVNLPQLV